MVEATLVFVEWYETEFPSDQQRKARVAAMQAKAAALVTTDKHPDVESSQREAAVQQQDEELKWQLNKQKEIPLRLSISTMW